MCAKRIRQENWEEGEKMTLVRLISSRIDVLESKQTDTTTNKKKNIAWCEIAENLKLLTGKSGRTAGKLKETWKRLKQHSKNSISVFEKNRHKTGEGTNGAEVSSIDWKIRELVPHYFIKNTSDFDSDDAFSHSGKKIKMSPEKDDYSNLSIPLKNEEHTFEIEHLQKKNEKHTFQLKHSHDKNEEHDFDLMHLREKHEEHILKLRCLQEKHEQEITYLRKKLKLEEEKHNCEMEYMKKNQQAKEELNILKKRKMQLEVNLLLKE